MTQDISMSLGLSTLNLDSNQFSNRIDLCEFNQCASIVSTLHCVEQIHACMLTSSSHTSTQCPCQICTSASHHIASGVEKICGTHCEARRSALTVYSWHGCACYTLFSPNMQLRDLDQSGSKPPLEADWD